ncbi:MAG: hypothetical protein AAF489_00160 [Bacteroidota bacterium]
MKKFKIFQTTAIIAMIFSISYVVNAQEIDPASVNPQDLIRNATGMTLSPINGTTTYDGANAGTVGTGGSYFGYFAGTAILAGSFYDTFMGSYAGYSTTSGSYNTYLGTGAGILNTTGNNNTSIGFLAGYSNTTGSGNVNIGYYAGFSETGNDKLYIENSTAAIPLIFGDFASNKVGINTKNLVNSVGGANTSAYGLYVKGGILTEELRVRTGWADYVFDSDYTLMPLTEVAKFIATEGHLPNVPSAQQVEEQGIEIGNITRIQQEKIEELTLYIIQLQNQLNELNKKVDDLSKK